MLINMVLYTIIRHPIYSDGIKDIIAQIPGFDSLDEKQWNLRMHKDSWIIILEKNKGIMAVHRRDDYNTMNVWFAGIISKEQKKGLFKVLISGLLSLVHWPTKITMTTRPNKFSTMFSIMSRFAIRCNSNGIVDLTRSPVNEEEKARFMIYGWQLWIVYHMKTIKKILYIAILLLLIKKTELISSII